MAPISELQSASRTYGSNGSEIYAVHDVDLTIEPGELLAIVGPSGSGKTTLLQLLGAMDRPTGGAVFLEGRDLARLGDGELAKIRLQTVGFVFQQFNLIPTLTAAQNVEVALAPRRLRAWARRDRPGARKRSDAASRRRADGEPRLPDGRGDRRPPAGDLGRPRHDRGDRHSRRKDRRAGRSDRANEGRPGRIRCACVRCKASLTIDLICCRPS
jgi:ABC-type sugar transport system ATPase subunit